MAGTTDRFDNRRAIFLERLIGAWDKCPEERLGKLIAEALDMETPFDIEVLRGIDNIDLVEKIERLVLLKR